MSLIHKSCGGTVEDDWSKTYEHEDSAVPSFVCQKCREEILGDADVYLEGMMEEFMSGPEPTKEPVQLWRVDVAGYSVNVRGENAKEHLEKTNRQLTIAKMALHRIASGNNMTALKAIEDMKNVG